MELVNYWAVHLEDPAVIPDVIEGVPLYEEDPPNDGIDRRWHLVTISQRPKCDKTARIIVALKCTTLIVIITGLTTLLMIDPKIIKCNCSDTRDDLVTR